MKRKCLRCNYYNNGVCDMGENGTEYDDPFCELGHNICNLGYDEKDFCCYLSDKSFKKKEEEYDSEQTKYLIYANTKELCEEYILDILDKLKIDIEQNVGNGKYDYYEIFSFLNYNDIQLEVVGKAKKVIDDEINTVYCNKGENICQY